MTFSIASGVGPPDTRSMDDFPRGTIWPVNVADFDNIQVREVYARYGLAMFKAQVLEYGMVNAVVVARLLPTMREYSDQASWEEAFERFYDVELAKTFGNMLRALEPLGLPDDLVARLKVAKVERDRLAHRFFSQHDQDFFSDAGRTRMIAECEDAIKLFDGVDVDLETFMAPQRERFGITEQWIEAHLAADIAQAESEEAS